MFKKIRQNFLRFSLLINLKQVPGITNIGLVPRRVNKVAILGGGLMGSGIATALILSNYPVILKEVNDKFLQAGIGRVRGEAIPCSDYASISFSENFRMDFCF